MRNFIREAFTKLDMLDEADFNLGSSDDVAGLKDFIDDDSTDNVVDVYDMDAETEDDLQDSYIGKVILECNTCKSLVYKDPSEVEADGDEVNVDMECPYCYSTSGYKVVGQVEEYCENCDEEGTDELADADNGVDDEEDELTESCSSKSKKKSDNDDIVKSNMNRLMDYEMSDMKYTDEDKKIAKSLKKKSVKESIQSINIETDDDSIDVSKDDDGCISVNTTPKCGGMDDDMSLGSDFGMDDSFSDELEDGDEVLGDITSDTADEIEDEDALSDEDEMTDVDFEDFDEDNFDNLGESYLKSVYDNVKGFKTTGVSIVNEQLVINGDIKFDSGKTKSTTFRFTPDTVKGNKVKLFGENLQISRGKKSFAISGSVKNKKLVVESLRYNYKALDESGVSQRVYNTLKVEG